MQGNAPVMSVRGSFYLTNITNRSDIVITRTFLQVFRWKGLRPSRQRFDGFAILAPSGKPFTGTWSSKYAIPAGETREAKGNWTIEPPIRTKGRPLRGRAYFVDQLDNEHRAKAVHTFRYMG